MLNSINTNIAAFSAQGNIGKASNSASASIARLSSGNRIVKASDDVAALSIGTSLKTGVTTLKQALSNTAQGSSLLQVADGALAQISDILQRQKAIATQANSGTLSNTERGYLQQEFSALQDQIDQIAGNTKFSSVNLLDGTLGAAGAPGAVEDPVLEAVLTSNHSDIHGLAPSGINITAAAYTQTGTGGEETFVGDLSQGVFTVTDLGTADTELWQVSFVFNNITYLGNLADATATGNTLALTNGAGTAKLTLTLATDLTADTTVGLAITNAADFQTRLNSIFDDATAVAQRLGQTGTGDGQLAAVSDTASVLNGGFGGATITYNSTSSGSFTIPEFENIRATGVGIGTVYSMTINGETWSTTAQLTTGTDITAGTNFAGITAGHMRFYKPGAEPRLDYVDFDLTTITANSGALDVSTQEDLDAAMLAMNEVFHPTPADGAAGSLTLQVGIDSTDTLSVSIEAVDTDELYKNAAQVTQTLDVSTLAGAQAASVQLDLAIATINEARASIGALQSRIDFTAANLQTSIQNQDAARGNLLDTDVAAESTAYATAQVQLQAGIAVLAQANQLPQNLLKLIS